MRYRADALELSAQRRGARSPLAGSAVALAGSAQNARERTLTVSCPAFRFPASKHRLAVLWSSCARSPLAKGTHWPRCPERRNCWCVRRLPWRCDWQPWSGTGKAFQSSWRRPGKGREESRGRTLLNVCNHNGGDHYMRISCILWPFQMFSPSMDRKWNNLEGGGETPTTI